MKDYTIKHDKDKLPLFDVPIELLEAVSKVMEYGKSKYGESTWHRVDAERYLHAMLRHIYAMQDIDENGKKYINLNKIDNESGLKHLYHVACNIAFIVSLNERK